MFASSISSIGRVLQDIRSEKTHTDDRSSAAGNEPLDSATLSALDAIRRASGVRRWSEARTTTAGWHGEKDMNEQMPPATATTERSFALAAGGRLMTRESVGAGVTTRSVVVTEPTHLSLLCWRHGRTVQPPFVTVVRHGSVEIVRYVDNIWRMKDLVLNPGAYTVEVINLGEEDVHLEMIRSAPRDAHRARDETRVATDSSRS